MSDLGASAGFSATGVVALDDADASSWKEGAVYAAARPEPAEPTRLILLNRAALHSGGGLAAKLQLAYPGAQVVSPDEALLLLGGAGDRPRAFERLVVAGGDGTLNRLLTPLLDADIEVDLVPAGTANDLFNELKPAPPAAPHKLDVVLANGHPFTTVGYLGFGSDVVRLVNGLRRKPWSAPLQFILGKFIYVLGVLLIGARSPLPLYRLRIRTEGRDLELETPLLVAANQPTVGGTMTLAAGTRNDDRRFRVLVFPPQGGWSLLRSIAALCRGGSPADAGVESFETDWLEVEERSGRPFLFCADGEELHEGNTLSLGLHPRQLRVHLHGG